MDHETASVQHIDRESSDHCMLILDTKPEVLRKKRRFCFDKRWIGKPGVEETVRNSWENECIGSPIHQVACKIKNCPLALLEWNRMHHTNSAARIKAIREEMGQIKEEGGDRDWCKWSDLKNQLENAYKEEELYWQQKSRVQWLKDGDKKTEFFHASVISRRKCNRMENLDKEGVATVQMMRSWWGKFQTFILACSHLRTQGVGKRN